MPPRRWPIEKQYEARQQAFRWLDAMSNQGEREVTRVDLLGYSHEGEALPLIDPGGRGIRNPTCFDSTLSVFTSPAAHPYGDSFQTDGTIRYSFRSGGSSDNIKLREAMRREDPLIYFVGIRPKYYLPIYPVYVASEDPASDSVTLVVGETHFLGAPASWTGEERRYASRVVRQRLHQPLFRSRVLRAYKTQCAICNLRHAELLDAAHIIEDSATGGIAAVSNGLALCKIHHASFDQRLIGISPNYQVHVNRALLEEVDGPMLKHGLQEMHGREITLPQRRAERPEPDRLAARFDAFLAASA